jgi:cbb3-type cytochrome oxidase subunit 3
MSPCRNLIRLALAGAALHAGIGANLVSVAFLLIFLGVILPAVWSTKRARRRAAAAVLTQILNSFRGLPRQYQDRVGSQRPERNGSRRL